MCHQFAEIIDFIKSRFPDKDFIPLHEPLFIGNEKKYLNECIDSTFVSSVGKFVDTFEQNIAAYTGAKYAVATVNGTAALHISLLMAGVKKDDLVITQPLSFIATCNAISYISAEPLFIDVDLATLGLSASKLSDFLTKNTFIGKDGFCYHQLSKRKISACVPMHTFGHPAKIDELLTICEKYNIALVEDAAESIGSFYKKKHTGSFGKIGAFSFNGNKTITCGGGGAIITDDADIAMQAKHITTQAKVPHKWEFVHDQIGYNYRMPNINAALACAQLENINDFIEKKRDLAEEYSLFFKDRDINFVSEPPNSESNYWLNSILLKDRNERDAFLTISNLNNVMTRPIWTLMNKLEMFKDCIVGNLENAMYIEERLVNIPSSVRN
jgi:perosamine synthetase